jgi:hypothetical protein
VHEAVRRTSDLDEGFGQPGATPEVRPELFWGFPKGSVYRAYEAVSASAALARTARLSRSSAAI